MFVLIFQNIDFYSAFSGTAAAINNLGPGLGGFSENYSALSDAGVCANNGNDCRQA